MAVDHGRHWHHAKKGGLQTVTKPDGSTTTVDMTKFMQETCMNW